MPGCVVDFGYDKKEKAAGKAALFENIYLSRSANTSRVMYPFILSPLAFIRSFVPLGSVIDILS